MELRKSRSCNAIMIPAENVLEEFKVLCAKAFWDSIETMEMVERKITGGDCNGEYIGCVIWSIYFYHFIYRKRLFSLLRSSFSHHDDVMYIYNELFSHGAALLPSAAVWLRIDSIFSPLGYT